MTCKDCIYADVCAGFGVTMTDCAQFKDKSQFIELPCKIGDTVYTNASMRGWYMRDKVKPYRAEVVFIGLNGTGGFMNVVLGNGCMLQFNFSQIGSTVFLTREAAKKALEAMTREGGIA